MSEWRPGDREAIRRALALPATPPCLDAIDLAMAGLARHHAEGVLTALPLLDAVAQIDQLLLVPGAEQEQAIEKQSRSGPMAGSVAANGDAPLQKADVIAYDTGLLREERQTTYAHPYSTAAALLGQRRRYAEQLLSLLPGLTGWLGFTGPAGARLGGTVLLRG